MPAIHEETNSRNATGEAVPQRRKVSFPSGDDVCVGWHYEGANGGCIVMAGGAGVTKEPGTDAFARRFHEAGFSVLAFDFRHLGESGGQPRQIVSIKKQQADYGAAIDFARSLPEVDGSKIAAWGFSLAGGHVLAVGACDPELSAIIAQTPLADARAAAPNAIRYATFGGFLRLGGRALTDAIGSVLGRQPRLIPLAAEPGVVAALNTPDAQQGSAALDPNGSHHAWRQEIAARSALATGRYRPGPRYASKVQSPLLVLVCDDDRSVLPGPGARAADLAPRGELVRIPGGHYAPFLEAHEVAVEAELRFLRRHVLREEATW